MDLEKSKIAEEFQEESFKFIKELMKNEKVMFTDAFSVWLFHKLAEQEIRLRNLENKNIKIKLIEICKEISKDVENDAKEFDGKPFDGKNVATYFGNHGAAIKALSDILIKLIE